MARNPGVVTAAVPPVPGNPDVITGWPARSGLGARGRGSRLNDDDLSAGADIGPTDDDDVSLLRVIFPLLVPARAPAITFTIPVGVRTRLFNYNGSVTWLGG